MISQRHGFVFRHPVPSKLSSGKQIVYRYNGDPKDDLVVMDRLGIMPFRRVGEIMKKDGKEWKVAVVRDDYNMTSSKIAIPVHRVFLTDKF